MELQGASRMSALLEIDQLIKIKEQQVERLKALKLYCETNPMPKEVEELMWSIITSSRGGYYI